MEGESSQRMKQKKERKGEGRRGRGQWRGEETQKKQIAEGGVFVSFDFRATGKTASWDTVEWRKGLGTGRCGMNAPRVDYTLRENTCRGQLGSHQCEG